MKILALIMLMAFPSVAWTQEATVYDQNRNPEFRVRDGRIYNRDWVPQGTITKDGRILDQNKQPIGKVMPDGRIIDNKSSVQQRIQPDGKILDQGYGTKGYIRKGGRGK